MPGEFNEEQTQALNAVISNLNAILASQVVKILALKDAAQRHEARIVRLEKALAGVAIAAAGVVDEEEGTEEEGDADAFTLLPQSPPPPPYKTSFSS